MVPAQAAGTAASARSSRKFRPIARRASQLRTEASTPMASESRNVFTRTSDMRQNSPLVTPPISNDTAITGIMASKQKKAFKEVAATLPNSHAFADRSEKAAREFPLAFRR